MVVNLIRTNPNNNHHVDRIQTNISNSISQALEVRRHANFPVRVVHAIKPRSFAGPLHVAFADQEPVKVEWSLICSDTNWRTENDDQWGEWEPKHFFQNLSQANPKSSKLPNVVPTSQLVTRCSWWWPTNTAGTHSRKLLARPKCFETQKWCSQLQWNWSKSPTPNTLSQLVTLELRKVPGH